MKKTPPKSKQGQTPGKIRKTTLARREKVRILFLQKKTQREIAIAVGADLTTVNSDISFICEEFLQKAREKNTFGQVLMELSNDRNTIWEKAWFIYDEAIADRDFSAATKALKVIDGVNANFVVALTRLGIIEEAPQKVEHSGGVAVLVRTPLPERKALK